MEMNEVGVYVDQNLEAFQILHQMMCDFGFTSIAQVGDWTSGP